MVLNGIDMLDRWMRVGDEAGVGWIVWQGDKGVDAFGNLEVGVGADILCLLLGGNFSGQAETFGRGLATLFRTLAAWKNPTTW